MICVVYALVLTAVCSDGDYNYYSARSRSPYLAPVYTDLLLLNPREYHDPRDHEGWNCGAITPCGTFGQVCGGYKIKGKGDDLHKTFKLPPGTYSVQLDFIKIDSWFVRVHVCHAGVHE